MPAQKDALDKAELPASIRDAMDREIDRLEQVVASTTDEKLRHETLARLGELALRQSQGQRS